MTTISHKTKALDRDNYFCCTSDLFIEMEREHLTQIKQFSSDLASDL